MPWAVSLKRREVAHAVRLVPSTCEGPQLKHILIEGGGQCTCAIFIAS
jgi:hypothetical protein